MTIIANENPSLRVIALMAEADTPLATAYDGPIIAWYLKAGRHSEPIAVPSLRGVPYVVLDRDTGRAEIPGGRAFATVDAALDHLRQAMTHPPCRKTE